MKIVLKQVNSWDEAEKDSAYLQKATNYEFYVNEREVDEIIIYELAYSPMKRLKLKPSNEKAQD